VEGLFAAMGLTGDFSVRYRTLGRGAMSYVAVLSGSKLSQAAFVSLLKSLGFESVNAAATLDRLAPQPEVSGVADLLLVDLPGALDVDTVMTDVKLQMPNSKVVFLSAKFDLEELIACFAAGANGYLLKTLSGNGLREALRLVRAGEKVFPSELAAVIGVNIPKGEVPKVATALQDCGLSEREIKILRLLVDGMSNKVIASTLQMAESTAKLHLRSIMKKLRVSNRTQAALWAAGRGLAHAEPAGVGVPVRAVRAGSAWRSDRAPAHS
jgi:two-component system nitrate/nitrite response regulator NarL